MNHISESIQEIIRAAQDEEENKKAREDIPVISISTRTSRASFIYERMRNALDYKEEHLIRRNAVERILRRQLGAGKRRNLGENLIHELIHARYLPNGAVPQSKISELEEILEKYFHLLGVSAPADIKRKDSIAGRTIGIMATEIDEFLVPPFLMHAAINAIYSEIANVIHLEESLPADVLQKQIYLASSRTLYKNDDDTLRYHLLLVYYPHWREADEELLRLVRENYLELLSATEADLNHPLKEKFNLLARKHVAYFTILREIIAESPLDARNILADDVKLAEKVKQTCQRHYQKIKTKLKRSAGRSVVYLLLTKFLLALLLEVPIEYFILGEYHLAPLAINFVFPPLLLVTVALSTKLPDEKNSDYIAMGVLKIVRAKAEILQLNKLKKRSLPLQFVFALFYTLLFLLSFGALILALNWLSYTALSMLIFIFFLSLVSLFAYRIRRTAQELIITPRLPGFLGSLWGFITIPVLDAGKWLSTKFAKINILILVLDFVIEAPFKSFIKITEDWMNYVHEKKEEI